MKRSGDVRMFSDFPIFPELETWPSHSYHQATEGGNTQGRSKASQQTREWERAWRVVFIDRRRSHGRAPQTVLQGKCCVKTKIELLQKLGLKIPVITLFVWPLGVPPLLDTSALTNPPGLEPVQEGHQPHGPARLIRQDGHQRERG